MITVQQREGSVLVLVLCPRFLSRHCPRADQNKRTYYLQRQSFWQVCFSGGVRVLVIE